MKKNKLLFGKRFFTVFSVFIMAAASFSAWAQPASEYCRWLFAGDGINSARFTWNTEANGDVTITIISAIEGETPGQTTFRGDGWSATRTQANLWVDVAGGTNWVANTNYQFFTKTLSADKLTITLTPAQTIPAGAKVRYNGTTEWLTSKNPNAYSNITFIWTYGSTKQCPDPSQLPVPVNVAVDAAGVLTFDAVTNAVSYEATVYAGSIAIYKQTGVDPTGTTLNFTAPGDYTVKVKALGDDNYYLNSLESEAIEWTVAGEIPALGDSEYCYVYWDPSGGGAQATSDDAIVLSWETLENGNITVTLLGVNGNQPAWRTASLDPANLRLGPLNINGVSYLNVAFSGNVCTISPKEGVTLPQGLSIRYQGVVSYRTNGGANPNPNLYPQGNFTYTYGSNCAGLERTKLAVPANVAVDEDGLITFDEVEDAATYSAAVYLGANLVYQQILAASGEKLNFPLPGTFTVRVTAVPDVTQMAVYEESDSSDPYTWTVNYQTPATVQASVYCSYVVNPTNNNGIPNTDPVYGDYDASYWSWTTDAQGQIVIAIDSAVHAEYTPTVSFRDNGMLLNGFRVGGVPGNLLLEKVGGSSGKTQTFKAKEGITLLPGIEITYNGQTEYRLVPAKPDGIPGAIHDLYPTLTFSTAYIYGSNCSGEATVLAVPENLAVANNTLSFDAVENASTYKVYVYDADDLLIHTQGDFTSGSSLTYDIPGHHTVKVQAIGNAAEYINSALSEKANWDLIATLAKPAGLKINTENKLVFTPVPAAVSYTVTIYESLEAAAVETLLEFESGSVLDMGEENYGTTYYVKVQAIGDGDVILDSELSDAYTWNFEEPYVCNLLLAHPLIKGSDAITFPKRDPNTNVITQATTAPYFAPGWNVSNDYTFNITDNVVSIHLGVATGANANANEKIWQAQFRVLPETPIWLKAGTSYDIKAKMKTSKSTPVHAKIFDYDDNAYIELIALQTVDDQEGKVFELEGVIPPGGLSKIFQILFAFGGNPADVDIEISDIVICGEEGEKPDAIPTVSAERMQVYPVPAKDVLHVTGLAGAKDVKIVDVTGKAVAAPKASKESIDVSALAKGIYILFVDGKTAKFTKN
jgi:hypothetical protein